MPAVRCDVVRWLSEEPQPGWVEATITDAAGRTWTFHEKPPIFTSENLTDISYFPMRGWLRCLVIGHGDAEAEIETTDTASVEGQRRFIVRPDDLAQD